MSKGKIGDNYADGKAAKVWNIFIGDQESRTKNYKDFICDMLRSNGCHRVLDVACGTGVDSVMLVEGGFQVTSVDLSDQMLKYALRTRWDRKKEPGFENWVIEEANWLTLTEDVEEFTDGGFDAVICLGNSFTHVLDPNGDQRDQRLALKNFEQVLRPGGILIIDHRNYDQILDGGAAPSKSIYYNSKTKADIRSSVLYEGQEAKVIMFDYSIDPTDNSGNRITSIPRTEFRLTLFPHRLPKISKLLDDVFGPSSKHSVYGDFKPLNEIPHPGFYVHVLHKPQ